MIRLKEQQLHILIWLMAISSVILFCLLGMDKKNTPDEKGSWKGMEDFSDGWICTYETTDEELYKAYQKEKVYQDESTDKDTKKMVVDVVTVPAKFSVKKGTSLIMTHKVPDINLETIYLMFELENANVSVYIDDEIIYTGKEKEKRLSVLHKVPVLSEYEDRMMTIEISDIESPVVDMKKIQSGTYNQMWITLFKEHTISLVFAAILLGISVCFILVYFLIKNVWMHKRLLFFSIVEGFLAAILCLSQSEILSIITGGSYGVYIIKSCIILIMTVLHLMVVRSFVNKKKVLGLIDTAILLVGVLYISVMVLQVFSLLNFDTIYMIGMVVYAVVTVLFTVVLAITAFDYARKEVLPVFIANMFFVLGMLVQGIMFFAGGLAKSTFTYVEIGFFVYITCMWVYGLRHALYVKTVKAKLPMDEGPIRTQIIESMNPNLLFASFQTLQNLIKQNSDKSIKMLYYISVYLRDNLRALEESDRIISFSDELEHIIAYLQLQKTRNQNLEIAIECKTKEFHIPRHSLEPLVENAVKHGIAKKNNKGNIAIRAYTRADGYAIQIIDDGAGFDLNILKNKKTTLVKKLDLLEKTCNAKTEVLSKEGKGTVITIVLPMLENELMSKLQDTSD